MRAADLLVAALESEGVRTIFGVPGEEVVDLLDSVRRSRIELVVTRHGRTAAFVAAAHGRLAGRAGVCLAAPGAGALDLATGAAHARLGGFPMVIVTGQAAARDQRPVQVDAVSVLSPLVKSAGRIAAARRIPALVRDAFRVAEGERPGPVLLELPEDVAGEAVGPLPPLCRPPVERPVATAEAVDRAAGLLLKAGAPLLMLGAAASRPRLSEALDAFVRRAGIPFFTTPMGKGAVACRSGLYMGTAALSERDHVHRAIDRADLVVAIGHEAVEPSPFGMGLRRPAVLHIGAEPATMDHGYVPRAELVGDIGPGLRRLADRVEGRLPNAGALLPLRHGILARLGDRAGEDRFPLTPQRIVHDVREAMPADGIVCLDTGIHTVWFARAYRTEVPRSLLLDNALAATGGGLPTAMAAAMRHPDRRVLAVCGDGGFLMSAQDLLTAVRLTLDLVVLVVRDDGYGSVRFKQAVEGHPAYGVAFDNPDFGRYAEAHGIAGAAIDSADGLAPALAAAFAAGGVHLVTVPVDYDENMAVLVDELSREANGADL